MTRIMVTVIFVLASTISWGQIVSKVGPDDSQVSTMVDTDLGYDRTDLPHNSARTIRAELRDETILRVIGTFCGLKEEDRERLFIVYDKKNKGTWLYGTSAEWGAFDKLSEAIRTYVRARSEGHTKQFMLDGMAYQANALTVTNPAIRAIIELHPYIPVDRLHLSKSGVFTKKAGEEASHVTTITVSNGVGVTNVNIYVPKVDEAWPWEAYTLVDGDVGWRYFVLFRSDGTLESVSHDKDDAKDYDPQYTDLMEEVDDLVHEKMKNMGIYRQWGSVHTFWDLKKKELKRRGINWRSPSELNPSTFYD